MVGSLPIEPLRDQIPPPLSAQYLVQDFKKTSSRPVNEARADMTQDYEWSKQKRKGLAQLQGRF